jgi:hypothetical protein
MGRRASLNEAGADANIERYSSIPATALKRRLVVWRIDVSEIPNERKSDPRFIALSAGMTAGLADARMRRAVSVHEAAHLIYFTKAGRTGHSVAGPRIVYDATKDEFSGYGASVQFTGNDDALLAKWNVSEWVSRYACGCAAGGIAARKLTGVSDGGDEDDRDNLKTFCAAIVNRDPDIQLDVDRLWFGAQQHVSQELENPKALQIMIQVATELDQALTKL